MGDSAAIGRLDFSTFIELAKTRLGFEFGSGGLSATEVLLTLNRASMAITYDLESAVHRPRGLSWASFRLLFRHLAGRPPGARKKPLSSPV